MGYIMDLRKTVGHRALFMPCGGVMIFNEKGQILLQKRRDNGHWGCPAGAMEFGETCEETAIREAFEETGLQCKKLEFFTLLSGEEMHYIYPNQDEVYSVEALYICKDYEGELRKQEEEVLELQFFDFDNLPTPIMAFHEKAIQMYYEKNSRGVV